MPLFHLISASTRPSLFSPRRCDVSQMQSFGIFEGRAKEDLKNAANACGQSCRDFTPPGGETPSEVSQLRSQQKQPRRPVSAHARVATGDDGERHLPVGAANEAPHNDLNQGPIWLRFSWSLWFSPELYDLCLLVYRDYNVPSAC